MGWPHWLPMHEVEPPSQAALEKPSSASEMPQTFTGALIGVFTVFPDSTGTL